MGLWVQRCDSALETSIIPETKNASKQFEGRVDCLQHQTLCHANKSIVGFVTNLTDLTWHPCRWSDSLLIRYGCMRFLAVLQMQNAAEWNKFKWRIDTMKIATSWLKNVTKYKRCAPKMFPILTKTNLNLIFYVIWINDFFTESYIIFEELTHQDILLFPFMTWLQYDKYTT